MLELDQILKNYSPRAQQNKKALFREYLQCQILNIIFKNILSKKLCFLGGTALRIIYGSDRFSEDLDFDNFGITEQEFWDLSDHVKSQLELEGYSGVDIKKIVRGAYRCTLKLPDVLYNIGLSGQKFEKIMIHIDTAPHGFSYKPSLELLNRFDIFTEIATTPIDIILSQKILTAFNRKRSKGRDFYDILLLLARRIKPNYQYLKSKLAITNFVEVQRYILKQSEGLDFKKLAIDVRPFLINESDVQKVERFPELVAKMQY